MNPIDTLNERIRKRLTKYPYAPLKEHIKEAVWVGEHELKIDIGEEYRVPPEKVVKPEENYINNIVSDMEVIKEMAVRYVKILPTNSIHVKEFYIKIKTKSERYDYLIRRMRDALKKCEKDGLCTSKWMRSGKKSKYLEYDFTKSLS